MTLRILPRMDNNYSLGAINLGLGGLGNAARQQMEDEENERKRKLVSLGLDRQTNPVAAAGLKSINIMGGGFGG